MENTHNYLILCNQAYYLLTLMHGALVKSLCMQVLLVQLIHYILCWSSVN